MIVTAGDAIFNRLEAQLGGPTLKDQVINQPVRNVQLRRQHLCSTAGQQAEGIRRSGNPHESALDGAKLSFQTTADDGVVSVARVGFMISAGQRQGRRVTSQRPAHQVQTGQDQATTKPATGIQRIDGGGCPGHDHKTRRVADTACTDQRTPAVDTQLARIFIAVVHPLPAGRGFHFSDQRLPRHQRLLNTHQGMRTRDIG